MKKVVLLLLIGILFVSASCTTKDSKPLETVATTAPNTKPIATIFTVGDVDNFNENLSPLASKLVKENPQASWWLLGDSGYGDSESVRENYLEIAAVIPKDSLYMVFGDHDYGTQEPNDFTKDNLEKTGAAEILNAKDTFMFTFNGEGNISSNISVSDQTPKGSQWSVLGINDICTETDARINVDCSNQRLETFKSLLDKSSKATSCSIAMWHHPVFAVIKYGGNDQEGSEKFGTPIFEEALANGVDIIINGDHHHFLATKSIDKKGELVTDSKTPSARQFIVGTGGAPFSFNIGTPKLAEEAIDSQIDNKVGVLKLDLFPSYAQATFISTEGSLYTTKIDC